MIGIDQASMRLSMRIGINSYLIVYAVAIPCRNYAQEDGGIPAIREHGSQIIWFRRRCVGALLRLTYQSPATSQRPHLPWSSTGPSHLLRTMR